MFPQNSDVIIKLSALTISILFIATVAIPVPEDLIEGSRTFTASLYKEHMKNTPEKNIIFSAISIQTIMSLLIERNENDPAIKDIITALSLPPRPLDRRNAFKSIIGKQDPYDYDFKVFALNEIHLNNYSGVEEWYKHIAESDYNAEIKTLNSENTLQQINERVSQYTDKNIPELFSIDKIPRDVVNLLINILYVQGLFEKPFYKINNISKDFKGQSVSKEVAMMTNNATYKFFEDDNAKYLKLKILREGGVAEMIFVLPNQQPGLSVLEKNVEELFQPVPFYDAMVQVTLPKFEFGSNSDLKPFFKNNSIYQTVQWGQHAGGFPFPPPLAKVTNVHKGFVSLSEEGVKTAAATSVSASGMPEDHKSKVHTFTADHPFLFYLTVEEAIVFAGRIIEI